MESSPESWPTDLRAEQRDLTKWQCQSRPDHSYLVLFGNTNSNQSSKPDSSRNHHVRIQRRPCHHYHQVNDGSKKTQYPHMQLGEQTREGLLDRDQGREGPQAY